MRKKHHICTVCGNEDAYTMVGRSLCSECADKFAKYRKERLKDPDKKKKAKESKKKLYDMRKEQGLCPYCGKKATGGFVTCDRCRLKSRKASNMSNEKKYGTRPRGEYGVCWTCNKKEVMQGKRLCKDCYEKALRSIDIANKKRIEKEIYPYWYNKEEAMKHRKNKEFVVDKHLDL